MAFWAASARCLLMLSLSSTDIPKSFSVGALKPSSAHPASVLEIAPTQAQDLALGLVELYEVIIVAELFTFILCLLVCNLKLF